MAAFGVLILSSFFFDPLKIPASENRRLQFFRSTPQNIGEVLRRCYNFAVTKGPAPSCLGTGRISLTEVLLHCNGLNRGNQGAGRIACAAQAG
jgi:hypothetical protein